MSSLTDIRDLIKKSKNVEIKEFVGWYLDTDLGRFTLAFDQYYLDKKPVSKKEIEKMVKEYVKPKSASRNKKKPEYLGKPTLDKASKSPTTRLKKKVKKDPSIDPLSVIKEAAKEGDRQVKEFSKTKKKPTSKLKKLVAETPPEVKPDSKTTKKKKGS